MADRRPGEPLIDAARRVAIDAVYAARDSGGTMHTAGAAAADAVLDLLEPIDEHLVDFGDEHFTVIHPLTERFAGAMHDCELHRWVRELGGPPEAGLGRYRAVRREPDTYSEDYGAEPWELVPLENRNGTAASGDDRG